MAIDFVHNGVRYISDSEGCFRYKNCNYLKFKLDETIGESFELPTNVEYYVNKCSSTYEIELSLSQQPDTDIVASIQGNKTFFENSVTMPKAKVRFHPNGGVATNTTLTHEYAPLSGQQATLNNLTKCSNAIVDWDRHVWKIDDLFTKQGYRGKDNWCLWHPTVENKYLHINTIISYRLTDSSFSDGGESLLKEYAPIYPNTYYCLSAQWQGQTYKLNFVNWDNSPVLDKDGIPIVQDIIFNQNTAFDASFPTSAPSSNMVCIGWQESTIDDNGGIPKYDNFGSYFLKEPKDVTFKAIWRDQGDTSWGKKIIYYNPNGGYYGVRLQCESSPKLLPTAEVSSNAWATDRLPCRPGFVFYKWYDNDQNYDSYYPGESATKNMSEPYKWSASWSQSFDGYIHPLALNTTTQATDSDTYNNDDFTGKSAIWIIEPAKFERSIIISIERYTESSPTKRAVSLRIFDETGETIPGSYIYANQNSLNRPGATSSTIFLSPNKKYYLELISEKVDSDRTYGWKTDQYYTTVTKIISPNGGFIMAPDHNYLSQPDISINFNSNIDWVGISNTKSDKLQSENLPGLPLYNLTGNLSDTGYWCEGWTGTSNFIPMYLKSDRWMTYLPGEAFSVSAIWNPNLFYIKYNGNGNDDTSMMSNTSHEYNNQVTIGSNTFTRSTKITYVPRYGNYANSSEWVEGNIDNTNIIIGTGMNNREVKLNHTHTGWKYNNTNPIAANYSNTFTQWKQDLSLTQDKDLALYGDMIELDAQWHINSTKLPEMTREGFKFLGWFTDPENGDRVGDENGYFSSSEKEITLYAHWEPIGLVQIYTDNGWKYAIPYIYDGTTWKRAMQYTYNGATWKQGAGSGQNMTNDQLADL